MPPRGIYISLPYPIILDAAGTIYSEVVCCVVLHPLGGAGHETTPVSINQSIYPSIYAGSVYTACVLNLSFFLYQSVQSLAYTYA